MDEKDILENLQLWRQTLNDLLSLGEFQTVCFDFDLKYDNMAGGTLNEKLVSFLTQLDSQDRLSELRDYFWTADEFVHVKNGYLAEAYDLKRRSLEGVDTDTSPYRGLEVFDEGHAEIYFGRKALTSELVQYLKSLLAWSGQTDFLAIIGASGSGKSSLVRAGILAELRPEGWPIFVMKPTKHPLESLSRTLLAGESNKSIVLAMQDGLLKDERTLNEYLPDLLASHEGNRDQLILVVDQFEELFTLCDDKVARDQFISNLLYALDPDRKNRLCLLVTLRADFYHRVAEFDGLRTLLQSQQKYIGRMSRHDLKLAIEGPALLYGYELEEGLVKRILDDVGDEPGNLPLLSHALLETWKHRSGEDRKTLTLAGYQKSGGVKLAIAHTADAVLSQFNEVEKGIARNIFLRLTKLGEGAEDTRRRARLIDVIPQGADTNEVLEVLARLATARLVAADVESVDVAHEALIREWRTLRGWLNADRDGLRLLDELNDAAIYWDISGRRDVDLYTGTRLTVAQNWEKSKKLRLNELETVFLQASVAQKSALEQVELERRAHEERQRKLAIRSAVVAGVFAIVALLFFLQSRQTANNLIVSEAEAVAAQATAVASEAEAVVAKEAAVASEAEAVVAKEAAVASEAEAVMAKEAAVASEAEAIAAKEAAVASEAEAVVAKEAAVASEAEAVAAKEAAVASEATAIAAREAVEAADEALDRIRQANIISATIITEARNNAARVEAEVATAEAEVATVEAEVAAVEAMVAELNNQQKGLNENISTLEAQRAKLQEERDDLDVLIARQRTEAQAQTMLSLSTLLLSGRTAPLTTELERSLLMGVQAIKLLRASADDGAESNLLNYALADAQMREMLDREYRPSWLEIGGDGASSPFAFDQENGVVTAVYEDDLTETWDIFAEYDLLQQSDGEFGEAIVAAAVSSDGSRFAIGNSEGEVHLWDSANGTSSMLVPTLAGRDGAVRGLAFSADGEILASIGADNVIRFWRLDGEMPLMEIAAESEGKIDAIGFSPVDGLFASADRDGVIRFWRIDVTGVEEPRPLSNFDGGHGGGVFLLQFSADGEMLASAGGDQAIHVWQTDDIREAPLVLSGHADSVVTVVFSADGQSLISGSADRTVGVWDLADAPAAPKIINSDTPKGLPVFAFDGVVFAIADEKQQIHLWDVTQPITSTVTFTTTHASSIRTLAFSPDGAMLASAGSDNAIQLWDVLWDDDNRYKVNLKGQLTGHGAVVRSLAFSPDGQLLLSGDNASQIHLWDLEDGSVQPIPSREAVSHVAGTSDGKGKGRVLSIVFFDEGRKFASADSVGRIFLWGIGDTITHTHTLTPTHKGAIFQLAVSPDGEILASAGADGKVILTRLSDLDQSDLDQSDSWTNLILTNLILTNLSRNGIGHSLMVWGRFRGLLFLRMANGSRQLIIEIKRSSCGI